MGKKRSDRDPAVQAALDGLKAQVKADIKRQRGIAMTPQTPSETKPRAAASGPAIARFLAIAERHVAGAPQRRPAGRKGSKAIAPSVAAKGDSDQRTEHRSDGDGDQPDGEQ